MVNDKDYKEDVLISEGGYGFVYKVHTTEAGGQKDSKGLNKEYFALKKMILQDEEAIDRAKKEVEVWRLISPHPYIVKYIDS